MRALFFESIVSAAGDCPSIFCSYLPFLYFFSSPLAVYSDFKRSLIQLFSLPSSWLLGVD